MNSLASRPRPGRRPLFHRSRGRAGAFNWICLAVCAGLLAACGEQDKGGAPSPVDPGGNAPGAIEEPADAGTVPAPPSGDVPAPSAGSQPAAGPIPGPAPEVTSPAPKAGDAPAPVPAPVPGPAPSAGVAPDFQGPPAGGVTSQHRLIDSGSSVVDKLIALEQDFAGKGKPINWVEVYDRYHVDFDPASIKGEPRMCVLLGFKIADGTVALKGQNAERLNSCADTIERLAKRLNIPESQLQRGFNVRSAVNRGDWMDAFMQLSLYRQDIMRTLEKMDGNDQSKAILIISGGWYQASRIVIGTIREDYDPVTTNYLRAPLFVRLMKMELQGIQKPVLKDSLQVKEMVSQMDFIYESVNIDRDPFIPAGQIKEERLKELFDTANRFVVANLTAEE